MNEQEATIVAQEQYQVYEHLKYPYGKPIEVKLGQTVRDDRIFIDGKMISGLKDVQIDSGMEVREVTFTVVHYPSAQDIVVSGYLIDDSDMELLKEAKNRKVEEKRHKA